MAEEIHDESYEHGMMFGNVKRTYDEMQAISLTNQHRSQEQNDKLNNLAIQAMQNAIETANMMGKNAADSTNLVNKNASVNSNLSNNNIEDTANLVNKQAVAHRDVSADRQWNSYHDQTADMAESTFKDQIRAELIKVLAEIRTEESNK